MKFKQFILSPKFLNAVYKYLSGVFVYGVVLLFYIYFPYNHGYLRAESVSILKYLYLSYLIIGPLVNYFSKEKTNKPLTIVLILNRAPDLIRDFSYGFIKKEKGVEHLTENEKIVLRFALVKIFYVSLMINFTVNNFDIFNTAFKNLNFNDLVINFRVNYRSIINLIFFIDTLIFCFGYLFEAKFLKNTIRSVEPTVLGWVVALAAYPPFSNSTSQLLGWYSSDNFSLSNPLLDIVAKLLIVILLGIYLWASISLGSKASNLTNRGIVTKGAYKYVRHPAYAGKVLSWWIMTIPVMSLAAFVSMIAWTAIYYLRAVTEERHLIADPDYQNYVKITKYRFFPGII